MVDVAFIVGWNRSSLVLLIKLDYLILTDHEWLITSTAVGADVQLRPDKTAVPIVPEYSLLFVFSLSCWVYVVMTL